MKGIFKNRIIVLTGIGRSGTSITGKVIGSMKPIHFLFEPALTKYMFSTLSVLAGFSEDFNRILFEDYFLNLIHGRGNTCSLDLSYVGNYETMEEMTWRRVSLRTRADALDYIKEENPYFMVKHTEFQYLFDQAQAHWPGAKYITVFRNGKDVIHSAMQRGWFTTDWCNNHIVEPTYIVTKNRIPYYIRSQSDAIRWEKWNPETRAACVWRTLNQNGIDYKRKYPDRVFQFRFEDFCKQPERFAHQISKWLNVNLTALTIRHIQEVHDAPEHDFDINRIEEPERSKFILLNKRLGYKI